MSRFITCLLLGVFLVIGAKSSFGQSMIKLKGTVISAETKEPLPFVTIGVAGTRMGAFSNMSGEFALRIPTSLRADSLFFSSVGYKTRKIPMFQLDQEVNLIELEEEITILEEFVFEARSKRSVLGLENGNDALTVYNGTEYDGESVALHVQTDSIPFTIKKVSLKFAGNRLEQFTSRMRIRAVDPLTDLPGEDLWHTEQISITSKRKGWLEFELEGNGLDMNRQGFFVTFDWLLPKGYRMKFNESGNTNHKFARFLFHRKGKWKSYWKYFNNDGWERANFGQLVAKIEVEY